MSPAGPAAAAGPLSCTSNQREKDTPGSGYAFKPRSDTIYDAIHRRRKGDYWREIFDAEASRYFHETGGTDFLRHFGYEQSADWWKGY